MVWRRDPKEGDGEGEGEGGPVGEAVGGRGDDFVPMDVPEVQVEERGGISQANFDRVQ